MFQEIWNEFREVKTHRDFLMNHNLRKQSINNKLFIHSVKIHKDFFKLIYLSYGLCIKEKCRGIKELLYNTWLKSNSDSDPFKIPHGWMEENEGVASWLMLSYPDIFNFLMLYPSKLDIKELSDHKNSKAYSYYKSGWLQHLHYHNLSGSKFMYHQRRM